MWFLPSFYPFTCSNDVLQLENNKFFSNASVDFHVNQMNYYICSYRTLFTRKALISTKHRSTSLLSIIKVILQFNSLFSPNTIQPIHIQPIPSVQANWQS